MKERIPFQRDRESLINSLVVSGAVLAGRVASTNWWDPLFVSGISEEIFLP